MSDIGNQINADLISAMKTKDADTVAVLRMVKTALKNKQIELGKELTDDDVLAVLQKEVKQRTVSAAEFSNAERAELADKEKHEAEILAKYLPAQLSDEELATIVEDVIASTGAAAMSDMGKVMGIVMGKTQGKADGSRVSNLVKQRLSQ